MIDLSFHNLTIGRDANPDEWFKPILDRGRGAAFVDTGFIRALIVSNDQYSSYARDSYTRAKVNFYTTNLVLAEVVRQIVKEGGVSVSVKNQNFEQCSEILIDSGSIAVCVPPREMILSAYDALRTSRRIEPTLDLCDLLSLTVLDYAKHRRVFGFDGHFTMFGAQLEP